MSRLFPSTRKIAHAAGLLCAVMTLFFAWPFSSSFSNHFSASAQDRAVTSGTGENPRADDTDKSVSEPPPQPTSVPEKNSPQPPLPLKTDDDSAVAVPHPFRRVYVPADLMESIPNRGVPYWPISAGEFERWATRIAAVENKPPLNDTELAVSAGYYRATLEGNCLIDGSALLTLDRKRQANPVPQSKHAWHFRPGNFAVTHVQAVPGDAFSGKQTLSRLADACIKSLGHPSNGFSSDGSSVRNGVAFIPDGTVEMTFAAGNVAATATNSECLPGGAEFAAFLCWTQQAAETRDDQTVFSMAFFPCLDITLDLYLPPDKVPTVDHGLVRLLETVPSRSSSGENVTGGESKGKDEGKDEGEGGADHDVHGVSPEPKPGYVLWRLSFGGNHRANLKIASGFPGEKFYPIRASQENHVTFYHNGMNFTASMELDAMNPTEATPVAPVTLRAWVDARLSLTSITYNRLSVPWTYTTTENAPDGASPRRMEILLELPGEVRGVGNILEFRAVENPRGPWKLENILGRRMPAVPCEIFGGNVVSRASSLEIPKITLQNVFWSEGKTILRVMEPLQMTGITPENGQVLSSVRRDISQDKKTLNVTEMTIQEFSEDAAIHIRLAPVHAKIIVHSATAMDFRNTEISAVCEFSFTVEDGERFTLHALVDPDWTVDSVETPQTPMIEDWSLSQPGAATEFVSRLLADEPELRSAYAQSGKTPALMRIHLSRALKPGEKIPLSVRMHRLGSPQDCIFAATDLSPVTFPAYTPGDVWLLAGTSSSWNLKLLVDSAAAVNASPEENAKIVGADTPPVTSSAGDGSSGVVSEAADKKSAATQEHEKRSEVFTRAAAFRDATFFSVIIRLPMRNTPTLTVEHRPPTYQAKIEGLYDLTTPSRAVAVFTVTCLPQNSPVDRLIVYIRPATFFDITWKFPKPLEGSTARCLEKISLTDEENLPRSCERWEIVLPHPQTLPFQFELLLLPQNFSEDDANQGTEHAAETPEKPNPDDHSLRVEMFYELLSRFPSGVPLNLVSLPEAKAGIGTLTLRQNISGDLILLPQRMSPLSFQIHSSAAPHACISRSFRYTPETLQSRINMPTIKINLLKRPEEQPHAWVWHEEKQTQFFPSGLTLHVVSWNVENTDESEFRINIRDLKDENIHILGILTDGQRLPEQAWTHPDGEEIVIPLPAWKRDTEITLQWVRQNPPLQIISSLTPPTPKTNLLVLNSTWKAWIPDNYIPTRFPGGMSSRLVAEAGTLSANFTGTKAKAYVGNSVLYRFFGEITLSDERILGPARSTSLGSLDDESFLQGGPAVFVDDQQWLSLAAISRQITPFGWDIHTGWTPYTLRDTHGVSVIHSSALEATRWFLLLLTFFIFAKYFQKYRTARVGLCGLSAALCLVCPIVLAPVFSGIFFGFILSFALHTSIRRRRRAMESLPKIIRIIPQEKKEYSTTRTRRQAATSTAVDSTQPTMEYHLPIPQENQRSPGK